MKRLVLFLLLALLNCNTFDDDLGTLCTLATKIERNKYIDPKDKPNVLYKEFAFISENEQLKYYVKMIPKLKVSSYHSIIQLTKYEEIEGWSCEPLLNIADH